MPARPLKPASPEAITEGCTCPRGVNRHGEGLPQRGGTRMYFPDTRCPLHGLTMAKKVIATREAVIVSDEPEDDTRH
jgi:hypothetical protein